MKKNVSFRLLSGFLAVLMSVTSIGGCSPSQHTEMKYEDNSNSNITDWDDQSGETNTENKNESDWDTAVVTTWDDVDDFTDWVGSQIIFDDITEDYPIIECQVLDFRTNGQYFDGEKVYTLVNDKFDVNSFISNYAVGSGVIVICVILSVATSPTPICCFFVGAADASISLAVKGAAFGAATKAVTEAIKSEGDIESVLYATLEGSSEGYKWGAIYGAITGGFSGKYCFTAETLVKTDNGLVPISDIVPRDNVYSYNEGTGMYSYEGVSQVIEGTTNELVEIYTQDDVIDVTTGHPFLTQRGWVRAIDLTSEDMLFNDSKGYVNIEYVEVVDSDENIKVYTLCVDNSHTFVVGQDRVVVHNRCNPNEKYADTTRHFENNPAMNDKYPDGVYIKPNGYPDFGPYARETVSFDLPSPQGVQANTCLRGDCYYDFKLANQQAFGVNSVTATPSGWTWHHCEDGRTMQLIPSDLHKALGHDGGEKVIQQLLSLM